MKIKILLITSLFCAAILGGLFLMKNTLTDERYLIEENYKSDLNCIKTYPNENNCLSESLGLYLSYLLETNNKSEFAKQVSVLKKQFLIKTNNETFIRWQLGDEVSVNALIDDVRIIWALEQGSKQFKNKAYNKLASQLSESLNRLNVGGIYVDFYDWHDQTPAKQITLSYITKEFADVVSDSEQTIELLKEAETDNVFFPENYSLDKQSYTKEAEVHMIDQLLIAINRHTFGLSSTTFDNWLIDTWADGVLYGRYERESLKRAVDYESLAVYAYLSHYFSMINEDKLASDVAAQAEKLSDSQDQVDVHFFDYIQNLRIQEGLAQ